MKIKRGVSELIMRVLRKGQKTEKIKLYIPIDLSKVCNNKSDRPKNIGPDRIP